ncbi:MAG: RidA family protein [Gammaproteobacteria bacterium]|nr:RidA family protein [Gammaproteobacteria bacterium]
MKRITILVLNLCLLNFIPAIQAETTDLRERTLISSGSKWEDLAAYSRAVVDGDWIFISGTAGINPKDGSMSDNFDDQMDQIFKILESTLAEAGATLKDLVRVRCYIVDRKYVLPMSNKLHQYLDDVRPASLAIVTQLPIEGALIEIEATARKRK